MSGEQKEKQKLNDSEDSEKESLITKNHEAPVQMSNLRIQHYDPQPPVTHNPSTKGFRFVHNSPVSMVKPRSRMKPSFKVGSQDLSKPEDNHQAVIIEQNFNPNSTNSNDRTYVFQLNVKRPPGRPRKNITEEPKAKRPQGRPRKYPIELTGTTSSLATSSSKISKKQQQQQQKGIFPLDQEASLERRGRGRPAKRSDDNDGTDLIDPVVQLQTSGQSALALAVAVATQSDPAKASEERA